MKNENIRDENTQHVTMNIFNIFFIEKISKNNQVKYTLNINFFRAFWLSLFIIFLIVLLSPKKVHTYMHGPYKTNVAFAHDDGETFAQLR